MSIISQVRYEKRKKHRNFITNLVSNLKTLVIYWSFIHIFRSFNKLSDILINVQALYLKTAKTYLSIQGKNICIIFFFD